MSQFQSFHEKQKHIGPMGWFLLLIPISTFLLGSWQVKRRRWKLELIEELKRKTTSLPVDLPEDLSELERMEYYPMKVRGTFLHDKELYMGPRSPAEESISSLPQGASAVFSGLRGQSGTLVITPFKLSDRDLTILVNRGWVPNKNKFPATRRDGQIQGEVELVGIVRAHEERGPFMPQNNPKSNSWFYRDVKTMSQVTGADPIFIDAIADTSVPGGPLGGQTRVSLRNEHLSYIFTWYTLSGITALLWHRLYIARKPLR
ncbi:hypothetical protein J437_LFUL012347 [Ladona fulva]|uniref:SURF1-like protein n=1 Tax=Ladona fulva TaxID=123851 RepID=A0A8K0K0R8_LADFU|nr:hypothetical protein J437_LFUL012347 [Ladona fulva]